MTEQKFLVSKFFPLILPEKHCLIAQNRFWPFFGILSGLLGVPRTIYFGCLSLYFDNFFARKTVGSRETPRDGLFSFKSFILNLNHIRRTIATQACWSLDQLVVETLGLAFFRPSVCSSVRASRFFSETAHYFFMKLYS